MVVDMSLKCTFTSYFAREKIPKPHRYWLSNINIYITLNSLSLQLLLSFLDEGHNRSSRAVDSVDELLKHRLPRER